LHVITIDTAAAAAAAATSLLIRWYIGQPWYAPKQTVNAWLMRPRLNRVAHRGSFRFTWGQELVATPSAAPPRASSSMTVPRVV
jgi:hypothetical protein